VELFIRKVFVHGRREKDGKIGETVPLFHPNDNAHICFKDSI